MTPFKAAILAAVRLHEDDFNKIEGCDGEELAMLEETMKACYRFLCALYKADKKAYIKFFDEIDSDPKIDSNIKKLLFSATN